MNGLLIALCCGLLMIASTVPAFAEQLQVKKEKLKDIEITLQLHIGTEDNRVPYSFLDTNQQPEGILLHGVRKLCEQIKAECTFKTADFDQMLTEMQNHQLQAMIIVDTLILPDIDQLRLTAPICQLDPVFIQRQTDAPRITPEDFRRSVIGVLEGSLLHLYLLDKYSSYAQLKTYFTLESGIIDLLSGRIDSLFADNAFFSARIKDTPLARESNPEQLSAFAVSDTGLGDNTMTLALHAKDTELLEKLEQAVTGNAKPRSCAELATNLAAKVKGSEKLVPKEQQDGK